MPRTCWYHFYFAGHLIIVEEQHSKMSPVVIWVDKWFPNCVLSRNELSDDEVVHHNEYIDTSITIINWINTMIHLVYIAIEVMAKIGVKIVTIRSTLTWETKRVRESANPFLWTMEECVSMRNSLTPRQQLTIDQNKWSNTSYYWGAGKVWG
jgi:hypothetical protein